MTQTDRDTPVTALRTCSSCGQAKPLSEFWRSRKSKDGLDWSCTPCNKARQKRYRDAHPETQARWLATHLEANRRYNNADRRRSPEKSNARRALERAVAAGRIVKPAACTSCGQGGRLEAHHDDYGRPLDVRWLCVRCHRQTHAEAVA